jgi:NADPH:quinone reductase-like Zn-dependent oxidoreductase
MPEMKVMEFTDRLSLQPVTGPVPQPKAGEILIQVRHWRDSYGEALEAER